MPVLYNAKQLTPAPFVDISKDYVKSSDGKKIGSTYTINIEGTILPGKGSPNRDGTWATVTTGEYPPDQAVEGHEIQSSLFNKASALRLLFATEGKRLDLLTWRKDNSGNYTVGYYCYPRINSVSINDNRYLSPITYSVSMEVDELYHTTTISTWEDGDADPNLSLSLGQDDLRNASINVAFEETENFTTDFHAAGTYTYGSSNPVYLSDVSEDWSIDVAQDKGGVIDFSVGPSPPAQTPLTAIKGLPIYSITHSMSATGKRAYGPTSSSNNAPLGLIRDAWENAKIWVENRVGVDAKAEEVTEAEADASGGALTETAGDPKDYVTKEELLGTTTSPRAVNKDRKYSAVLQTLDWGGILASEDDVAIANYGAFNVVRTQQVNVHGGTYSVTETFLYADKDTFDKDVTEDISVDTSFEYGTDISSVTLNGTITGFRETADGNAENYDKTTNSKYTNAATRFGTWTDINAHTTAKTYSGISTLHEKPVSTTVARNEIAGTVSFSFVFNDRPNSLELDDVPITETLRITDNAQADAFATIAVPGRRSGPVLQNLNTKAGPASRTVDISITMGPNFTGTGLHVSGKVYDKLVQYKPDASVVFKTADTQNYEPWTGTYSRSITWQHQSC